VLIVRLLSNVAIKPLKPVLQALVGEVTTSSVGFYGTR
jgi:hypothetical protein